MAGSCPIPAGAEDYTDNGTAHTPMLVVSVMATCLTFAICVSLIVTHLRRYRCPREQRQLIRIIFAPVVYAAVGVVEIASYRAAPYVDPLGDLYESFGLCALFLLYVQFCAPGGTFDAATFAAVAAADESDADRRPSFDWPRLAWILVFQYPLLELLSVVVLESTQAAGVYCLQSLNVRYGHIWVEIISSLGVSVCVFSIIRFYGRTRQRMHVRRGLAKLLAFKLIVGVRFLQSTVFSILLGHNIISPGPTFSYNDLLYGLPSLLICVEMVVLSAGFWYAYSSSEYSTAAQPPTRTRMATAAAIFDALNPSDLVRGIAHGIGLIGHAFRFGLRWGGGKGGRGEYAGPNQSLKRFPDGNFDDPAYHGSGAVTPLHSHYSAAEQQSYPMSSTPQPQPQRQQQQMPSFPPPRYDDPAAHDYQQDGLQPGLTMHPTSSSSTLSTRHMQVRDMV